MAYTWLISNGTRLPSFAVPACQGDGRVKELEPG